MPRSNLCGYSNAYMVVAIDLGVAKNNGMTQKGVVFKNKCSI